eukprot:760031-Hanusia_phi.AAC.7
MESSVLLDPHPHRPQWAQQGCKNRNPPPSTCSRHLDISRARKEDEDARRVDVGRVRYPATSGGSADSVVGDRIAIPPELSPSFAEK